MRFFRNIPKSAFLPCHSGKKTCERIAEENGVSRASVLRARHYTKGIDIADTLSPGIKKKVFSGEVKFTNDEMSKLVQSSPDKRQDVFAEIMHPEITKAPGDHESDGSC